MIQKTWPITGNLIFNALQLTEQLYQLLIEEADTLQKPLQAELIDSIAADKKQLVMQLEQFNQQCGQVLATEELPNNHEGIDAYFQRATSVGLSAIEIMQQWTSIQELCIKCRALNEQNGASIELLSFHTQRSLQILKGNPQRSNTYGANGARKNDPFTHTLFLV